MQLVIDIDEYDYKKAKELVSDGVFDYEGTTAHLFKRVANGTPTHKKGKWDILGCDLYMCSKCYAKFTHKFNYCPNCGAEMESEE
jgi:hypothetical protein